MHDKEAARPGGAREQLQARRLGRNTKGLYPGALASPNREETTQELLPLLESSVFELPFASLRKQGSTLLM